MINITFENFWHSLNEKSKKLEENMNTLFKKRTGSYYTDMKLTDIMVNELIEYLKTKETNKKIYEYRFLEPCVGCGNFVFSYIKAIKEFDINREEANIMFNNIYVSDININALAEYKSSLKEIALLFWNINLSDEYFKNHIGTGLLINVTAKNIHYINIGDIFPSKVLKDGFDIIITNPPYKNLKAEHNQYENEADYIHDKNKYAYISKIVSHHFKYSNNGILNLYKLFVEDIIINYSNNNAIISLLIPASIMSDKTCSKLRTYILKKNKLLSLKIIKEKNPYINAQQALSVLLLQKGEKTNSIKITKDFCSKPNDITTINLNDILNENTGNSIMAISPEEYTIIKKLQQFPIVRDLPFIINSRGEFDLTINKHDIVDNITNFPLIKGKNIGYYKLLNNVQNKFVSNQFINITKKKCYIEKERIACKQIANINKDRRVTFSLIPKNYILGNSCNFIAVMENSYNIDIYALLGLFNTKIINWLFKLNSSNNHVNNYEIDSFPIPLGKSELNEISILAKKYLYEPNEEILVQIEKLAYKAYDISESISVQKINENIYINKYMQSIKYILPKITKEDAYNIIHGKIKIDSFINELDKFNINVAKGITKKYISLFQGKILNHITFKLSDLDLEMIKSIPQGGNWKYIPLNIIKKSKRLQRISQTGGRSTLYGRIDYNKPSYTITTYFNRPGNGTYVHPIHQRVLSVREAARFQTFKDDYYFFGNKTQYLKQIGNAVPTLLAYQIAQKIKLKTNCSKSIDLFCGAGGMSVGFKAGGIKSILCNDIEESACITLKINNPEINVLCGDITKDEIKNTIEKIALKNNVDIISGGPPCQGFSLAGLRAKNDPRNQLFKDFIDIVKRIHPKIIVFENVPGLLSFQNGKIYKEIHNLFEELGYNTEGRNLMASDYAIPQKRKRIIIICTKNNLNISPSDLFPDPITVNINTQVTAKETIADLEKIDCDEDAQYINFYKSDIIKFFRGLLSYPEYIQSKISNQSIKQIDSPQYEQLLLK